MTRSALPSRVAAAFLWLAAFSFANGFFLSITLLFGYVQAAEPVAVGIVPILHYSKLHDYVGAATFLLLVPPLTIWLHGVGERCVAREQRLFTRRRDAVITLLFTTPFLLAPLLYLTTGKYGWVLLMPVALAFAGTRSLQFFEHRFWLRQAFLRELRPYRALIFAEALSWILFRYLVVGHRFAHFPTLLLEAVFVAIFLGLFWAAALYASRLNEILFGTPMNDVFRRIASAGVPLVLLPLVPLIIAPTPFAETVDAVAFLLVAFLALRLHKPFSPGAAWKLAAYLLLPLLVYWISYGTTAHQSDWVDLFHRGESIGPASDYLRGKAPFRDIFALHGMLQDRQLDAWLMELFGRSLDVSVAQTAVLGGFLAVSLWYLGIVIFESIPLAVIVVLMGSWTTAENNRTSFQVAAVAL